MKKLAKKLTAISLTISLLITMALTGVASASASTPEPVNIGDNYYVVISDCNANAKAVSANGESVSAAWLSKVQKQIWKLELQSDNSYKLKSAYGGKYLEVKDSASTSDAVIQTADSSSSDAQKWYFIGCSDGNYSLIPKCAYSSCMALNINYDKSLSLSSYNESATQILKLINMGNYLLGDTNRDSNINIADATEIQKILAELITPDDEVNLLSDVNGDEFVDIIDATVLQRYCAGYFDDFRTEKDSVSTQISLSDSQKAFVFDAGYYASKYPELKSEFGEDEAALYQHFLDYGLAEGKQAHPCFDAVFYLNNNPDLKEAYGTDFGMAVNHYLNIGKGEGKIGAAPDNLGDDFYSKIAFSGKNLSIYSSNNVIIYTPSDSLAQVWHFVRQTDGSYKITNVKYGMCLEVENGSDASETNVKINSPSDSLSQLWYIYAKDERFVLRPACSSSCVMNVEGGKTAAQTNIQIYTYNGTSAQAFYLNKTDASGNYLDTPNTGDNTTTTDGATPEQMEVIRKIIYAVETGGQVYGNVDYSDFTEAYANSSIEYAITIGGGQWYGVEAKTLLNLIRSTDPATFASLDTAGIASDLDSSDWSKYSVSKTSAKAKCIKSIISSAVGIKCQDQLLDEQMSTYMEYAKSLGVTEIDAQMMCANIRHQGGTGAVKRVLGKTATPYTLDNIYAALKTDTGNQVGAYKSRQKFVYNSLKTYL